MYKDQQQQIIAPRMDTAYAQNLLNTGVASNGMNKQSIIVYYDTQLPYVNTVTTSESQHSAH
jgi:hypothetical protein